MNVSIDETDVEVTSSGTDVTASSTETDINVNSSGTDVDVTVSETDVNVTSSESDVNVTVDESSTNTIEIDGYPSSLKNLSDVDTSLSPIDNDLFVYDGSKWTNQTITEAGFATVSTSGSYNDLDNQPSIAYASTIGLTDLNDYKHNDTSNKQGGTSSEYYHLTNSEHTEATRNATNAVNGLMPSSKLDNWDSAYGKRVDTWGDGLDYNTQTASVDYNTTNLKITTTELNTIQDIDSTASPTFNGLTLNGDLITANAVGRDSDNELAWTTDDQIDITIGGTTSQIVSISSGTGDNDKLVTQGYVDDQILTKDTLAELNDTNITSLSDNELLQYDNASSKWINQTITEAGFATVATSGDYTDLGNQPSIAYASTIGLTGLDDYSHTSLTDIGTNTHAQIDTFISNVPNTYVPYSGATQNVDLGGYTIIADNLSGVNTGDQDLSGLVPYSGASGDVDLGSYDLDCNEVRVSEKIVHDGDTNTYISFTTDRIRFYAGNENLLTLYQGAQDYVKLGDGGDVDINLNNDAYVIGDRGFFGAGTNKPHSHIHSATSFATGTIVVDKPITLSSKYHTVFAAGRHIVITLPPVQESVGRHYWIKNIGEEMVRIATFHDEGIEFHATYDLKPREGIIITNTDHRDYLGWYILGRVYI